MKQCKLLVHQSSFRDESLLLNPKEFPFVNVGDILEIYLTEDEYSRLLLQVTTGSFYEEFQQKDAISIEQTIASSFQLRTFADVIIGVVQPKDVALESVELTFKDQYLARTDMWRLKKSMVNMCVYLNKKIEQVAIRCQVYEMWAQGERVACGVVTDDTKLVFRSASSMVYLFIQMSAEMWDFDINGDLYFEKAVNGFLSDLFAKWKKLKCNHDVTIVLFSRTYYEAQTMDEFPIWMRDCLRRDHRGRYFEDFYRVAVQNERYEDWSGTLILLKKIFNCYLENVLKYHSRSGVEIPHAINSTSSQGNFLEVLNMSLNVFEKHYMDRSFDRTGQLSVVLSPGVGVFEVDRELANITKQRIIDNGIGSDLVCLGEQPLHAVPLFKFHSKANRSIDPACEVDDYNMPHWINLSFYSSAKCINYSTFVPRIKMPSPLPKAEREKLQESSRLDLRRRHVSQPEHSFPLIFDYDEYDVQIFKLPTHAHSNWSTYTLQHQHHGPMRRKSTVARLRRTSEDPSANSFLTNSEPAPATAGPLPLRSPAITIPQRNSIANMASLSGTSTAEAEADTSVNCTPSREENEGSEFTPPPRAIVGSAGSPYEYPLSKHSSVRCPRALINPFDPSHVTIKLTSNRRRWTHVFPLGPTGIFMQQHHYQAIPQNTAATLMPSSTIESGLRASCELLNTLLDSSAVDERKRSETKLPPKLVIPSVNGSVATEGNWRSATFRSSSTLNVSDRHSDRTQTWLWGATGEQEWTPALTTGVDWKSLVIPACLPLTTDYFPDKTSLDKDYLVTDYHLLPEAIRLDRSAHRCFRGDDDVLHHQEVPSTMQVFEELVCQRLQQSFQIILFPKHHPHYLAHQNTSSPQFTPAVGRAQKFPRHCEEYYLSIGRIFHKLALEGSKITVTQYRPRHPFPVMEIQYCYRFRAPDNETYGISCVDFVSETLETFNWNHLDHYICQRGDGEFVLKENLKYWRLRMVLLPSLGQAATRRISDSERDQRCDIYTQPTAEEVASQREGMLKFLELVNRVRRPASARKAKILSGKGSHARRFSLGQSSVSSQVFGTSGFRDRVGSMGAHVARVSRSKAVERLRSDLSSSGRVSPAAEADLKLSSSNTSLEGAQETENGDELIQKVIKQLTLHSSYSEIVESLKQQGGPLFLKQAGLAPNTFISAEAISWLHLHVDDIDSDQQAVNLMQSLLDQGYICHASGAKHPFVHGFYLYYIPEKEIPKGRELKQDAEDLEMFQKEWLEVEIPLNRSDESSVFATDAYPSWEADFSATASRDEAKGIHFKQAKLDIHASAKSDRAEWGHLRYHSCFRPYTAFEFSLEWMVASGNVVADLVGNKWIRKTASCNLHLLPIPSDPFALPFSSKSDPLRGPIYIPLELYCLPGEATLHDQDLVELQDKILQAFGFIEHCSACRQMQYIHISGCMFVLLPSRLGKEYSAKQRRKWNDVEKQGALCSSHEQYISQHFSRLQSQDSTSPEDSTKVVFLWSWNYMVTKRWKTAATGEESFMRKVMYDFRNFCNNHENRLTDFYARHFLPGFHDSDSSFFLEDSM